MTIYLTERHLPSIPLADLKRMQQAACHSSVRFTAAGKPVHYLRSIWLPGDDQMLCLFQADDPAHVRDVNEAAGLPFTRIVEVQEWTPSTQS